MIGQRAGGRGGRSERSAVNYELLRCQMNDNYEYNGWVGTHHIVTHTHADSFLCVVDLPTPPDTDNLHSTGIRDESSITYYKLVCLHVWLVQCTTLCFAVMIVCSRSAEPSSSADSVASLVRAGSCGCGQQRCISTQLHNVDACKCVFDEAVSCVRRLV